MTRRKVHFPTVWKNAKKGEHRAIAIVYWKRVEYYGEGGTGEPCYRVYRSNKEDGTFDPFSEEEMLRGGGFKRVFEGE